MLSTLAKNEKKRHKLKGSECLPCSHPHGFMYIFPFNLLVKTGCVDSLCVRTLIFADMRAHDDGKLNGIYAMHGLCNQFSEIQWRARFRIKKDHANQSDCFIAISTSLCFIRILFNEQCHAPKRNKKKILTDDSTKWAHRKTHVNLPDTLIISLIIT